MLLSMEISNADRENTNQDYISLSNIHERNLIIEILLNMTSCSIKELKLGCKSFTEIGKKQMSTRLSCSRSNTCSVPHERKGSAAVQLGDRGQSGRASDIRKDC